jgi:hypothetical protein
VKIENYTGVQSGVEHDPILRGSGPDGDLKLACFRACLTRIDPIPLYWVRSPTTFPTIVYDTDLVRDIKLATVTL